MNGVQKILSSLLVIGMSVGVQAQSSVVTPQQLLGVTPYESPSCNSSDHHEFDFMHGTWSMKVFKDGKWVPGGYSVHKPALGGCVSFEYVSYENWGDFYKSLSGRAGLAGFSISSFDKKAGNWRQVWHDDTGSVITTFRGRKFKNGMRFVGHAPGDDGAELQKLEWTVTGEGLRELTYDMSTDGGRNWTRIARVQMIQQADKETSAPQ